MKPSEILKAHEDGLVIEWKYIDQEEWKVMCVSKMTFLNSLNLPNVEYRTKKKPRTFWVVLRKDGSVVSTSEEPNEINARKLADKFNNSPHCADRQPYTVVKVTEGL